MEPALLQARRDVYYYDIDFGQSGLAGEMTWGDGGVPWEQRRLPTGKGQVLKYAFELR